MFKPVETYNVYCDRCGDLIGTEPKKTLGGVVYCRGPDPRYCNKCWKEIQKEEKQKIKLDKKK